MRHHHRFPIHLQREPAFIIRLRVGKAGERIDGQARPFRQIQRVGNTIRIACTAIGRDGNLGNGFPNVLNARLGPLDGRGQQIEAHRSPDRPGELAPPHFAVGLLCSALGNSPSHLKYPIERIARRISPLLGGEV